MLHARSPSTLAVAIAALLLLGSAPAAAFEIDWDTVAWDVIDEPSLLLVVNDADGSGVGMTVEYTDNAFHRFSFPDVYNAGNAPTAEIEGTLRITSDRAAPITPVVMTITFSEDVILSTKTVSHSTIQNFAEHSLFEAFDSLGAPVAAADFTTTTPALVSQSAMGAAYETVGVGAQEDGLYGNAFYDYDAPVRQLRLSFWTSLIGLEDPVQGWGSMGLGNIAFRTVPEPTTAALLGFGLLGLARAGRRRT